MLLVVCKLAKIWFVMQCTLFSTKCSFYFFLQEIFFIRSFSAKHKGMFLQYRSDSSWCFSPRSFVSFHLLFEPELSAGPLFWGESCSCCSISHQHQRGGQGRANLRPGWLTEVVLGIDTCRTVRPGSPGEPQAVYLLLSFCSTRTGSWAMVLEMIKERNPSFSRMCLRY